jgi:hypothetical protein
MKLSRQIALIASLLLASSCAFFNGKTVQVAIDSNPQGADIFIEGRNYGRTPAVINVEPKVYTAVISKEGYGTANLPMDIWWGTMRTDINGERTSDGTRCMLDMLSVFFSFNAYTGYCSDFKQKQYIVTIPHTGSAGGSNSMMGLSGRRGDMIDYYYNPEVARDGGYRR